MRFSLKAILIVFVLMQFNATAQNLQDSAQNNTSVTIGNIYITGNNRTREEIIIRELDFEEGDVYQKNDLLETITLVQQKLTNTRLFVTVEVVPLTISADDVDILIRLQERWYIFPIPIFRLADRNFTEWWVNQKRDFSRVNWGAQLDHMNLTGRNDRLSARLQFGFTKNVALKYSVPYINKSQKLGLSFGVSYSTNKTVGITSDGHRQVFYQSEDVARKSFSTNISLIYRPSFYTRHTFDVGYNRLKIQDSVAIINPSYLSDGNTIQNYFRFSYLFSVDKRDFIAYPLTGSLFRLTANQFGLGIFDDLSMTTARIGYGKYFKIGQKFFQANRIETYKNFSNQIPYVLRAGFGYRPNFIRGYERYVVESDMLISYRTALKFQFLEGILGLNEKSVIPQFRTVPYAFYLKTFIDVGYSGDSLLNTENNFYNNELIGSIGIGLDIVTYYDFVMRLEYSINREGNTGFYFNFRTAL